MKGIDSDLIERATRGEAVALRLVLTLARPELCRYVASRLPPAIVGVADPDDVTQEVLFHVFRHIESFSLRGTCSFQAWLRQIADHRIHDAIRRANAKKRPNPAARKNVQHSSICLLESLQLAVETPSAAHRVREAADAVQKAIGELPTHYRQAIWETHFQEKTAAEAASQMGCTKRSFEGTLDRARKMLRVKLGSLSQFL